MKETKLFVIPLLKKSRFHMNRKSPGGSPGELDNIYIPEHILRKQSEPD
jgi:hypothetical protein